MASSHSDYFQRLSDALDRAQVTGPALVLDRQRLKNNLDRVVSHLQPHFNYRIVAKSLPCLALLEWLMNRANTRRLMVFSEPSLRSIVDQFPDSDILMGKPIPVHAARSFYEHLQDTDFAPERQLQWLIDTPQRLAKYAQLADTLDQTLQLSLEINIGLERGGFSHPAELDGVIEQILQHPRLKLTGFMGYEPHIVKAPGSVQRHQKTASERYQAFVERAKALDVPDIEQLILNTGGSMTYSLYARSSATPANEVSVGSALVQPTDFDLPSLASHEPAAFIAAPVLKVQTGLQLPGAPAVGAALGWLHGGYRQTFFIDGGHWKAYPESPRGLRYNTLFGRSSNQEMLNGPADVCLKPDDWIFFRPTQSESVLLQFGDLLVYDTNDDRIKERWPVMAIPH